MTDPSQSHEAVVGGESSYSRMHTMRTLVAGWFSFDYGNATAGDLLTRDLACSWLDEIGCAYDIAVDPPFQNGVDWRKVDPEEYSHVVFVCGPFTKGAAELEFLARFGACRLIGLNLSMNTPLEDWNPFDFLIERDSSQKAHPDMAFLCRNAHVPIVGVCLVEDYPAGDVDVANAAIRRLLAAKDVAVVQIDTRLDVNSTGLRTPSEVESLLARMDAVVTTRLHGTVLSLKNGVPALAIDPERGGAKIRRQAELIGWPVVFNVDELSDTALADALDYCLTESARITARRCAHLAAGIVEGMREKFISELTGGDGLERRYQVRTRMQDPFESDLTLRLMRRPTELFAHQVIQIAGRVGEVARRFARRIVEPVWRWVESDHERDPLR